MTELTSIIVDQDIHVTTWAESTWGTKPGSTPYVFLPLTQLDVAFQAERRENRPFLGQFGRNHGRRLKGMPRGSMGGLLHGFYDSDVSKSLAEFVLDWVFDSPTSNFPPSIGLERAEGPNVANEQFNGLRVNQFTLTGSEDSGVVSWTADVMGHSAAAVVTAQTIPNDLETMADFEFADVSMTVDHGGGAAAEQISEFTLVRNNALEVKYLGALTPQALFRTDRLTTFSFNFPKQADTYDVYRRLMTSETELDIILSMQGLHNGTAANDYTTCTIDMERCQIASIEDANGNPKMVTVNCVVLKPDSSTADVVVTFGTA